MQKPRGTKDIFGNKSKLRNFVFQTLEQISKIFNFKQIEVPIFEFKNVFVRSIGEASDVVAKEMYHFKDKSNRDLVLRPEGTAGVIRAVIENKLYSQPLPLKLFYLGPMFRYENPQKGRQRQFTQYGIEVLGPRSPYLDAEVVLMAVTILDALKIKYVLKINSLGDQKTRDTWTNALRNYFSEYKNQLEPKSLLRLTKNPARILDDKDEMKKPFVKNAPPISKFYSQEAKEYFKTMHSFLEKMDIQFTIDHNLVRGFDYYTDIVFEFLPLNDKSSQSTMIGGGRYNNLVAKLGGPNLSGIGFAIGIERLISYLDAKIINNLDVKSDVYVINIAKESTPFSLSITYLLRRSGFHVAWNYLPKHLNKGLEKADKEKALIKVIIGIQELATGIVNVKTDNQQILTKVDDLVKTIKKIINTKKEGRNEKE